MGRRSACHAGATVGGVSDAAAPAFWDADAEAGASAAFKGVAKASAATKLKPIPYFIAVLAFQAAVFAACPSKIETG